MKPSINFYLLILFFIHTSVFSAIYSQADTEQQSERLTLKQILELTRKNYGPALALAVEKKAVAAEYRQKQSWENPRLAFQMGQKDSPGPDSGLTWGVNLSQPFAAPGERSALSDMAESQTTALQARIEKQMQQVKKQAVLSAYRYLAAVEKVRHANERVGRLRLVKKYLYSRPFVSPQNIAEKQIVEEKLRMMQLHLKETRLEVDRIWSELNLFLNLEKKVELKLSWSLPFTERENIDYKQITRQAEQNNRVLKSLKAAYAASQAETGLNRARAWPSYSLSAYYNEEPAGGTERFYGGGITFALPLLNRNSDGITAAEKKSEAASFRLNYYRKRLRVEAERLINEYRLHREAAEQFSFDRISSLERDMKKIDAGFRKGRVELMTYLETDEIIHESITESYEARLRLIDSGLNLVIFEGRSVVGATDAE